MMTVLDPHPERAGHNVTSPKGKAGTAEMTKEKRASGARARDIASRTESSRVPKGESVLFPRQTAHGDARLLAALSATHAEQQTPPTAPLVVVPTPDKSDSAESETGCIHRCDVPQ